MNKNPLSLHLLGLLLLSSITASQLCAQNNQNSNSQDNSQGQGNSQGLDQGNDPYLSQKATLPLKWRYGWADGNRANTIGSAANNDPHPAISYYISTGYSPKQISNAYGFNNLDATNTGSGKIIALIESFGSTNIQADLNAFDTQYGIPATTVNIAYPSGKPTNTDYLWAMETTLDVEWAHAMSPGATIWVIVEPDATLAHLFAGIDYSVNTAKAKFVSMSWGMPEFSTEVSYNTHFTNQTVTFVASAGDNQDTNWPSTSPYVLAVGGTTMMYDTNTGTVASETAWNGSYDLGYGPGWGGGGGFSQYEKVPQYQTSCGYTNSTTKKSVPDVSYNGDPYTGYSIYFTPPGSTSGGWLVAGGTSAGAPQWAALASRCTWTTNKAGKLNFIFGTYFLDQAVPQALTDITTGDNGVYPATIGYDLATGLGTPQAIYFGYSYSFQYGSTDIFY